MYRTILSDNLREQSEDEDFDGDLRLSNEDGKLVSEFFEKLSTLRIKRLFEKDVLKDTDERLTFISFLKSCIKTIKGIELPSLKIENKYSHLDFSLKVQVFSEVLFDDLWFNISNIKLEDGTIVKLGDVESKCSNLYILLLKIFKPIN